VTNFAQSVAEHGFDTEWCLYQSSHWYLHGSRTALPLHLLEGMCTSAAPSARYVADHILRIGWICTGVCTAQIWRISLQTFWKASDRRALSWMTWRTASGGSRNSRYAAKTDARTKNCRGKEVAA